MGGLLKSIIILPIGYFYYIINTWESYIEKPKVIVDIWHKKYRKIFHEDM